MPNAEIYQKTASDRVLIIEPQVGWLQPFNVGSWTQLAIGVWWSATTESDDNAVPSQVDAGSGAASNLMTLGLKTNNLVIPLTAGTDYIGYSASNITGLQAARYDVISSSSHTLVSPASSSGFYVAASETTVKNSLASTAMGNPGDAMSTSTNYCSFFALRFTIANLGLSTQTIAVARPSSQPATTTPTIETIRSNFGSVGFTAVVTGTWNDGVSAYAIPDAMFMRFPWTTVRARIHAFVIEKLA